MHPQHFIPTPQGPYPGPLTSSYSDHRTIKNRTPGKNKKKGNNNTDRSQSSNHQGQIYPHFRNQGRPAYPEANRGNRYPPGPYPQPNHHTYPMDRPSYPEQYGPYGDPSFRQHPNDGYRDRAPVSPQVPWRQDVPVRNQYGPLEGYGDREERDLFNTGPRTRRTSSGSWMRWPPWCSTPEKQN